MALVSPHKGLVTHPLLEFRRAWNKATKGEKQSFDFEPWKEDLFSFLHLVSNSGSCVDIHNPGRATHCTCMQDLDFENEEEQEAIVSYLFR
jgi:hypothetical protein